MSTLQKRFEKKVYKSLKDLSDHEKEMTFLEYITSISNVKSSSGYFTMSNSFIEEFYSLSNVEQILLLVLGRFAIENKINKVSNNILALYCGWANDSHVSKYLKQLEKKGLIKILRKYNSTNLIKLCGNFKAYTKDAKKETHIYLQHRLFDFGIVAKWKHITLKLYIYMLQNKQLEQSNYLIENKNYAKYLFWNNIIPSLYKLSKELKVDVRDLKEIVDHENIIAGDGFCIIEDKFILFNFRYLDDHKFESIGEFISEFMEEIVVNADEYSIDIDFKKFYNVRDIFSL